MNDTAFANKRCFFVSIETLPQAIDHIIPPDSPIQLGK